LDGLVLCSLNQRLTETALIEAGVLIVSATGRTSAICRWQRFSSLGSQVMIGRLGEASVIGYRPG
jgi:hypothetical protein